MIGIASAPGKCRVHVHALSFREPRLSEAQFPRISLLGNRVNSPVLCNPAALLQAPPPGCLRLGRGRRGLAQRLGECAEDPIQCQPSMAHSGEKCFWVMRKPQGRIKNTGPVWGAATSVWENGGILGDAGACEQTVVVHRAGGLGTGGFLTVARPETKGNLRAPRTRGSRPGPLTPTEH